MKKKPHPSTSLIRLLIFAIGMFVLAGLLTACGSGSSSQDTAVSSAPESKTSESKTPESKKLPKTIRIGFQPPYVPIYVLKDQKLFEKTFGDQVPNIEFKRFLSLAPITEALSSGAIDLAIGGTPVTAVATDQPIRILALTERSPKTHAILVRPDSKTKSINDLKGKKIGTPSGNAYFFPQKVLQSANIKDSEVNWVKIENDVGRSALLSGSIDAWVTWDPFYASAEITKEAVPLVDGEKYHPNYVVLMGNAEFVEAYPEVIAQFIQAYQQALTWVQDHPADAVQIFAEANQVSQEIAELTMSRRTYLLKSPDDEEFVNNSIEQGKFFVQVGVTKKEPDWDTVIVPEIAKSVLGQ
ncbi:MAG: aliphatic sulfonate ABC transporter substrate-binding protein [Bacillus thermozeamaize]|uniref:Putative aliphatic sulfonates-binding protein n=1 Tax=Bacillus thermozeamaize TaxID=230954 RepID=A0A1Y3PSH7_9BACI|nr:MAG: aliphatic sulfonate ABC transporter substrate-binding protein [Bacillus thermozeamaize]